MSFKRDGDDEALLHNLKMRRVGEILGDNIPDDEATLLSNGRLSCLICSHRPIFDTLSMLAIHRRGKKHVYELGKYLSHKRELQLKQLKTDHQNGLLVEQLSKKSSKKSKVVSGSTQKRILEIALPQDRNPTNKHTPSSILPSPTAEVRHYLKQLPRKRTLEKTVERCRENYVTPSSSLKPSSSNNKSSVGCVQVHKNDVKQSDEIKHNLQLRMSGWIKDKDDKWIKDPNVEFDSDEDEPPEYAG